MADVNTVKMIVGGNTKNSIVNSFFFMESVIRAHSARIYTFKKRNQTIPTKTVLVS